MTREEEFYYNCFMAEAMKLQKIRKRFMHWYKKGKEWREHLEKRKTIRKANDPYYNQHYE